MPRKTPVDVNIQALVRGLNELEGMKTLQSCDGHGSRAWVTFACLPSMVPILFRIGIRQPGVSFKRLHPKRPEPGMAYLSMRLDPRWANSPLSVMQSTFLNSLSEAGLRTQTCELEMKPTNFNAEFKSEWHPDVSSSSIPMTAEKYDHMRDFVCAKLSEMLGWGHGIRIWNHHRATRLTGNVASGEFEHEFTYERWDSSRTCSRRIHALCDVRWQGMQFVLAFHERGIVNPYEIESRIEMNSLTDRKRIESLTFEDDRTGELMLALVK